MSDDLKAEIQAEVGRLEGLWWNDEFPSRAVLMKALARIEQLEAGLRLSLEVIDDAVAEVLRFDPHIQHPDGTGWDCGLEVIEIRRALEGSTE